MSLATRHFSRCPSRTRPRAHDKDKRRGAHKRSQAGEVKISARWKFVKISQPGRSASCNKNTSENLPSTSPTSQSSLRYRKRILLGPKILWISWGNDTVSQEILKQQDLKREGEEQKHRHTHSLIQQSFLAERFLKISCATVSLSQAVRCWLIFNF